MAKKTTPIITHTEILVRAIHSIEAEIAEWRTKCEGVPQEQLEAMFSIATAELRNKLDALKQLYLIETGTDYVTG